MYPIYLPSITINKPFEENGHGIAHGERKLMKAVNFILMCLTNFNGEKSLFKTVELSS